MVLFQRGYKVLEVRHTCGSGEHSQKHIDQDESVVHFPDLGRECGLRLGRECLHLGRQCLHLGLRLRREYLDIGLNLGREYLDIGLNLGREYLDIGLRLRREYLDIGLNLGRELPSSRPSSRKRVP